MDLLTKARNRRAKVHRLMPALFQNLFQLIYKLRVRSLRGLGQVVLVQSNSRKLIATRNIKQGPLRLALIKRIEKTLVPDTLADALQSRPRILTGQ